MEIKRAKCRLLVDNIANQDTEKVSQTVSVASVERTALAAAIEDHVWAKASSVRMAAKKRAGRTESETCQGDFFLKSWERIIIIKRERIFLFFLLLSNESELLNENNY